MNVEAAQAIPIATELQNNGQEKTARSSWPFDVTALLISLVALFTGLDFWRHFFLSYDRVLCSLGILLGLLFAVMRSTWQGEQTKLRMLVAFASYVIAGLLIVIGVMSANPTWCGIAFATILAGWCALRIRGESLSQPLSFGFAFLVPFAIEAIARFGGFEWLEATTVQMTSLLANAVGMPNARMGKTILFDQGVADHFSTIGTWDGVVGLLGIGFFCILAFRRNLVPASLTSVLSVVVWIALRSLAWVALSYFSNRNETWFPWSVGIEMLLFLIGVAWVVSLDQFFSSIFNPIPFEMFRPESPLCSFAWNWLCGLPNVALRFPEGNKIALWWKMEVKIAGKTPSLKTDFDWLRFEFLSLLFNPITALGSIIDAFHAWRDSRHWRSLFSHLPSFALLASLLMSMTFALSKRTDNHTQFLSRESHKICSTDLLEDACGQLQEPEFCKAIGVKPKLNDEAKTSISVDTKRQVEFLCNRILAVEPTNKDAKYRLGMIYALNENNEGAFQEMNELASSFSENLLKSIFGLPRLS